MSLLFNAQWMAATEEHPQRRVSVTIATTGREESPVLEFAEEADICGFKAGILAGFGEGQITSSAMGKEAGLRIIPTKKLQPV